MHVACSKTELTNAWPTKAPKLPKLPKVSLFFNILQIGYKSKLQIWHQSQGKIKISINYPLQLASFTEWVISILVGAAEQLFNVLNELRNYPLSSLAAGHQLTATLIWLTPHIVFSNKLATLITLINTNLVLGKTACCPSTERVL